MDSAERTTVNSEQTEFFKKLSAEWWNDKGIGILKKMNSKVIEYVCNQISDAGRTKYSKVNPLHGLKILEVGCGGGILSEELARTGCELTGIDPNTSVLQVAKDHAAADSTLSTITYVPESVEEHCKMHADEYDIVIANFVLEHVDEQQYFVKCCAKCVKPGGSLFISMVSKTYLAWFLLIFLLEYTLRILPVGIHSYEKFMNPSETEGIIKSCGFNIKYTQGMLYDVITANAYWIPIHSYLYITHGVKNKQVTK
ncbi:hypothetical protein FQR65_LT01103 [Abscondita terminalis]|nr:hypothetical protein FQR65_LT01103 [Abscondita terminalis]